MKQNNVISISNPQETTADALTSILRQGAQQLLAKALEAEIETLLAQYSHLQDQGNSSQVVRNGYLPERAIQTGIGTIQVKVPRIRDRGGQGIKFTSSLIPPSYPQKLVTGHTKQQLVHHWR